jgi:polar amino acid transport system substrate-binding protein
MARGSRLRQPLDYVEPPFMMDPVSVIVRRGEGFSYATWDDLKGRRGVTNAGESFGNAFDRFMASSLTVARAQGVDKAFDALLDKRADYLIIGLYPGRNKARKLGIAQQVTFLPKAIVSQPMYVGFSKKSKCNALKADFAKGLRQAVAAGRVQPLLEAAQKRAE